MKKMVLGLSLACLMLLCIALSGCSGDEASSANPAPEPTADVPTPTASEEPAAAWAWKSTVCTYNGEPVEFTNDQCVKTYALKDGSEATTTLTYPEDWTKVSFTYGRTESADGQTAEFHFTLTYDQLATTLTPGKKIQSYFDRKIDSYSVPDESMKQASEAATMSLLRAYFLDAKDEKHPLEKEAGGQTQFYLTKPGGPTDITVTDGSVSSSWGYVAAPVPGSVTDEADEALRFVVEYDLEGSLWAVTYEYMKS